MSSRDENIQKAREHYKNNHVKKETIHHLSEEQIIILNQRLGKDKGAKKERKRLLERIQK